MDAEKKTAEKKPARINWLSIFGIVILVLIIGVVIWMVVVIAPGLKNPIVKGAMRLEPAIKEMETLTQSQIEQQAAYVPAEALLKDPYGFDDRYVVSDGTVSGEETSGVDANIALGMFEGQPYKGYVIEDGIVVLDITGEGPDLKDGSVIKAYGKLFIVRLEDIWKLPVVGPDLKKEYADIEGMAPEVVFLISKGIKVISTPQPAVDTPMPPTEGQPDEAGAATPPADGTAPPADGAAPPADGTTPPPAAPPAEGTTPPPAAPPAGG